MQDILKNACPRFEFILLKTKVNLWLCTQGNISLYKLSNFSPKNISENRYEISGGYISQGVQSLESTADHDVRSIVRM